MTIAPVAATSVTGEQPPLPVVLPWSAVIFIAKMEPDTFSPSASSLMLELDLESPQVADAVQRSTASHVFWSCQYPCRVRIVPECDCFGADAAAVSHKMVDEMWTACCCASAANSDGEPAIETDQHSDGGAYATLESSSNVNGRGARPEKRDRS